MISRAIVALWFPDPPSSQSQYLLVVPPPSDGAMLTVLVAVFSHPLVVLPTSEGATLTFLEAAPFLLPISESSEAWLSKSYVGHEVPLVDDLSGPGFPSKPLFDNDRDTKGKSQLKHEVGHASSNRFVVSYDLLGSTYFKVSRVEV